MLARLLPAILFVSTAFASTSVWEGVYSTAQAQRGAQSYAAQCSRCHRDDLGGYGGVLVGGKFMEKWREDKLKSFFDLVKTTMPRNAPASLSDKAYLDIVAYVLQYNAFPAGSNELKMEALEDVRIQNKEGPEPVPDFSLVQVTGCLSQRADGEWIVSRATEPVRTRKPDADTPDQLKTLAGTAPGSKSFRLMDLKYVNAHPPKDQKVQAKGFLIRQAGDDRLNTTSVGAVAAACDQ